MSKTAEAPKNQYDQEWECYLEGSDSYAYSRPKAGPTLSQTKAQTQNPMAAPTADVGYWDPLMSGAV